MSFLLKTSTRAEAFRFGALFISILLLSFAGHIAKLSVYHYGTGALRFVAAAYIGLGLGWMFGLKSIPRVDRDERHWVVFIILGIVPLVYGLMFIARMYFPFH